MTPDILSAAQTPALRPGEWRELREDNRRRYRVARVDHRGALMCSGTVQGNNALWPVARVLSETLPSTAPRVRKPRARGITRRKG